MSTLVSRLRHYPRLNLGLQRLWAWAGGVSVRTKILGIVLTLNKLVEMVKSGKATPVSERLPQSLPYQRVRVLQILEEKFPNLQLPPRPPCLSLM